MKPVRFITFVIATAVLSSCVLFEEDLADPVPGIDRDGSIEDTVDPNPEDVSETRAADKTEPTAERIASLGELLEACRADAVVTEGVIWLKAGVEADDIAGLDEFMTTSPLVTTHRYIGEEETFEDFLEYFADEPEILELVTPANLPTSFEVVFDDQADIAGMVADIELFGIVDFVKLDPDESICLAEVVALQEACDQPPDELEVSLLPNVDETTVASVSEALDDLKSSPGFVMSTSLTESWKTQNDKPKSHRCDVGTKRKQASAGAEA